MFQFIDQLDLVRATSSYLLLGQDSGVVPVIAGVGGLAVGAGAILLMNQMRAKDLKAQAQAVLDKAAAESENIKKSAELAAKEESLKQQKEVEKEANKLRNSIQKKESQLERREEQLNQTADDFKKQEKMVEASQRRLTEKMQENSKRSEQLQSLITKQTNDRLLICGKSVHVLAVAHRLCHLIE